MRKRYGLLFKEIVGHCILPSEHVHTEYSVLGEEQWVDVYIDRDLELEEIDPRLGLLGRITASRGLLEAFHQPPSVEDVGDCLTKQRLIHARRRREAAQATLTTTTAETPPSAPKLIVPTLWILSAGNPKAMRQELGFVPLGQGWPEGVYTAPEGFALRLVVISELPVQHNTLLLRLMGARHTLRDAVRELHTEYREQWESAAFLPWLRLLQLTFEQTHPSITTTPNEREEAEDLMDIFEEERKYRDELKAEGALRAKRADLLDVIEARGLTLSQTNLDRVNACSDLAQLRRWLLRAAVAHDAESLFRDE